MQNDLRKALEKLTQDDFENLLYENISPGLNSFQHYDLIYADPGQEMYRLLCVIASFFENETFFYLGTGKGLGPLCLSTHKKNRVISYDTQFNVELYQQPDNLEFRIGDCMKEPGLWTAALIVIAVDPLSAEFNSQLMNQAVKNNYKGFFLIDGIASNPSMKSFWQSCPGEKKDLTRWGHSRGTGFVIFSE